MQADYNSGSETTLSASPRPSPNLTAGGGHGMAIPESTRTCSDCGSSELFKGVRCKPCYRTYQRRLSQQYRDKNRERERVRVREKQRRIRGATGYQRPVDPLKDRARWTVNGAIRWGKIVKPETCSQCGEARRLSAHHEDYNKPLEVTWLCSVCHGLTHRT